MRERDGEHWVFVKGAPERVVPMCASQHGGQGVVRLDVPAIASAARELAAEGLRVLAMAYVRLRDPWPSDGSIPPMRELVFVGLQAMWDPPRPGVRDAIQGCRAAGIRVVMITGDHADTAGAIARAVGIGSDEEPVLTGVGLEAMSDETLAKRVAHVSVYARVTPDDKLRIVKALQQGDQVVAVTGDGVNDAQPLKAAEIGIAMGRGGTDVAREASDMVLADDNFVSIYRAVEQGRIVFDNLRKATFFLISTGAAEVVAILTALALRWPLLFLPAQILWLNLVTNGLQDVALAFEPGERDVLKRHPRRSGSGIVSALLWQRTLVTGLVMAAGTLVIFGWVLAETGVLTQPQTAAVSTMVLFQAFHAGNARSERASLLRISPAGNRFLLVAVLAALLVHVAAVYLPAAQFVLRFDPFPPQMWGPILVVGVLVIAANEAHKLLRRRTV